MNLTENLNIIVTDDHALFRKGLINLLHDIYPGGNYSEASNGQELIDRLAKSETLPDLVLLDINMPVMDGVKATEIIRKDYPDMKIIILTMENEDQLTLHMIEAGVNGYLLKDCEPEELGKAIRMVMEKDFYFNYNISELIRNAYIHKLFPSKINHEFSTREIEVLELVCKELTTNEIADKLSVSPRTVETHRKNLIEKAGVKNLAGLIVFAIKNKIVKI
ncbi:MAG: response regulator transcription factor [Prolixibacteraceae bacterium]|nr:response regulator transcription factor [Prolixibacteraceae bacterium]MBN2774757.1 response regulator transcription factor [Prolixibacteraceae bacterium]